MEWVETTARTVEEARELALDQLGVDESEAEFEVLEEPRAGLFGRTRGQARVRARVQPRRPRAKNDGRDSRRRRPRKKGGSSTGERNDNASTEEKAPDRGDAAKAGGARSSGGGRRRGPSEGRKPRPENAERNGEQMSGKADDGGATANEETSGMTLDEQGAAVATFLDGLLEAFEIEGTTTVETIDDEMIEIRVEGEDVGPLIGHRGNTMQAVQELARSVVQRQGGGQHEGRFRVDVGGYRQRRREALERFVTTIAEEVRSSGTAKALEPMGAADRKVVHDTINGLDGVGTISEGEDPNRRVVIVPADAAE